MSFEDYKIDIQEKAALVSLVCDNFETHDTPEKTKNSLRELRELLKTLGVETASEYVQNRHSLDPASMLGKGKLEEIAIEAKKEGAKILAFDFELTASQVRNIKKITELDVIDRITIILEIFARHARTNEAKIQVEISKLQYMLPRLQTLWTHFSKQKGGIGLKGEGEQQLELDRRIIRRKIESYKEQLKTIEKSRIQQRKKRQNKAVTAALVGYTNAGKSSLMNKLCKVNVLSEDKLFATLDSTFRTLNPDSKPPMILIDTVGFIQNLPSTLVAGFKTTLESALEADLIIIVCDISDPNYKNHLRVTKEVLEEIGVDNKDHLVVFTKKDKLVDLFLPKIAMRNLKASFLVNTHDDEDISELREFIIGYFLNQQSHYDLFVPYEKGEASAKILKNANVLKTSHHETGTFYRIRIPEFIFHGLGLKTFIMAPELEQKLLK